MRCLWRSRGSCARSQEPSSRSIPHSTKEWTWSNFVGWTTVFSRRAPFPFSRHIRRYWKRPGAGHTSLEKRSLNGGMDRSGLRPRATQKCSSLGIVGLSRMGSIGNDCPVLQDSTSLCQSWCRPDYLESHLSMARSASPAGITLPAFAAFRPLAIAFRCSGLTL